MEALDSPRRCPGVSEGNSAIISPLNGVESGLRCTGAVAQRGGGINWAFYRNCRLEPVDAGVSWSWSGPANLLWQRVPWSCDPGLRLAAKQHARRLEQLDDRVAPAWPRGLGMISAVHCATIELVCREGVNLAASARPAPLYQSCV